MTVPTINYSPIYLGGGAFYSIVGAEAYTITPINPALLSIGHLEPALLEIEWVTYR